MDIIEHASLLFPCGDIVQVTISGLLSCSLITAGLIGFMQWRLGGGWME